MNDRRVTSEQEASTFYNAEIMRQNIQPVYKRAVNSESLVSLQRAIAERQC